MRPTFIVLGETRIKLSNIKQYGITEEEVESFKEVDQKLSDIIGVVFDGGTINLSGKKKIKAKNLKQVLYVTTYQGDNYRFREDQALFDIKLKLTELDNYLT